MRGASGVPPALPRALPDAVPAALPSENSASARNAWCDAGLRARTDADFSTEKRCSGRPVGQVGSGRPFAVTLAAALVTFALLGFAGLAIARPACQGGAG